MNSTAAAKIFWSLLSRWNLIFFECAINFFLWNNEWRLILSALHNYTASVITCHGEEPTRWSPFWKIFHGEINWILIQRMISDRNALTSAMLCFYLFAFRFILLWLQLASLCLERERRRKAILLVKKYFFSSSSLNNLLIYDSIKYFSLVTEKCL